MTATTAPVRADDHASYEGVAAACDVCRHTVGDHDRIATRYCTATQTHALSRGCICSTSDFANQATYG